MKVSTFAMATAGATFVLLLVGGTVNPSGSSLACPDWPLCHGSFFPEMTNGVQFEHTHRLVAGFVALMTIVLAALIWRQHKQRSLRLLGVAAVALVLVQAVLGGVTVLLQLPLAVSAGHLAVSLLFFVLMLYLSFRLRRSQGPDAMPPAARLPGRALPLLAAIAVYGQILLGALVRHTQSGRACGADVLLCNGEWWPLFGPGKLHMLHRFAAVVVFFIVVAAAISAARQARLQQRPLARLAALAAPWIAALQIVLGLLTVWTYIGLVPVTAHLGVGALLLATFVVSYLGLGPLGAPNARTNPATAGATAPATT